LFIILDWVDKWFGDKLSFFLFDCFLPFFCFEFLLAEEDFFGILGSDNIFLLVFVLEGFLSFFGNDLLLINDEWLLIYCLDGDVIFVYFWGVKDLLLAMDLIVTSLILQSSLLSCWGKSEFFWERSLFSFY